MRTLLAALLMLFVGVPTASAHVVVTPNQVGKGEEKVFSVSVPNEKDVPVIGLRLLIPDGVTDVTPTVKSGWIITPKKDPNNTNKVTEIDWIGGQIPAGQRDDFSFSAQAPASVTTLAWKAYQTYADGTTVNWDQVPGEKNDNNLTPYSTTQVINDLQAPDSPGSDRFAREVAGVAVALAAIALLLNARRR